MVALVACVGTGKGTWAEVNQIITEGEWNPIYIITNEFGKEKFNSTKKFETLVLQNQEMIGMVEEIRKYLDGKLRRDVAVNFASGEGREHMALISALLKLGVGIRFVALTKNGMSEI